MRKTLTTLALCTAAFSALGAGTALAEEVVIGHYDTSAECSDVLMQHAADGDPGPLMCAPTTDDLEGPTDLVRG
ncbi:hypothetical protein LCD36_23410 [Saccharopolyspora sp. 6T]|uniref:hypothetical protein n=1 Tax=Saccharopolyspora sp. 6T TaxID=2877238 RepID=UPI001CD5DA83|nr:hypothetical protein [Saccharopolyspora sp. 6T]MCA1189367.1 hypothetical protein [Saccharopolyspora sp. 6T]